MSNVNNILNLSGGKDSLFLGLEMLRRGVPIHSAVYVDMGWEFPWMVQHINELEKLFTSKGVPFVRFDLSNFTKYLMFDHAVFKKQKGGGGELRQIGKGWPSATRRWCTTRKNESKDKYILQVPNAVSCVGMAADEVKRTKSKNLQSVKYNLRFPLIEWGITEEMALKGCRELGFFGPGSPYDHFKRVSCFCCPLQSKESLRIVRKEYPHLWKKMLNWGGADVRKTSPV